MAVAAGGSDATNVVWLAEQCQLLERRNLSLRREVRSLTEALAAAAADADTLRLRLTATEEAVQSVTLKAGGAARREEKLLVTVESLRARIREVEAAAAVTLKERRTEGRILGACNWSSTRAGNPQAEPQPRQPPSRRPRLRQACGYGGIGSEGA